MKVSHTGVIAVMLVVIAIALAGCTSTQTSTTQAAGSGQATSAAGTGAAGSGAASSGSQGSGSAPAAGSSVSAADIFGSTPASYNWVEYKDTMSGVAGGKTMVVYMKWDKSGACSMRFENPPQGMPASMDCSSTGTTTQNNPNDVKATSSGVQFTYVGPDVVTVPDGTFTANKYTATMNGNTVTYWVASGKPVVKITGGSSSGSMTMELNAMG
ncbi:hypothetical protein [Methanoregula sp.]|uniref:hypothetical protein n=1 Tax=Methanoregula sp. TaxID=2052170 RepID=UPI003C792FDE